MSFLALEVRELQTSEQQIWCFVPHSFSCSKSGVSSFSFPREDEKCSCNEWLRLVKRKDFTPTAAS